MSYLIQNNQNIKNSLVVVSAKEQGRIFSIDEAGNMEVLEHIEEHPASFSDNEGFFFRSAGGMNLGSGYPQEEDGEHNLKKYITSISEELHTAVEEKKPSKILVFEPDYLKGLIEEHLPNPNHIPIQVVAYGNYVNSPLEQIAEMLKKVNGDELDPADPASVDVNKPNADEKRKILEVGKDSNAND